MTEDNLNQDTSGLAPNETWISRADLEIYSMTVTEDDGTEAVYVRFTGFEDQEEAEEYSDFLEETLPLLLFETTRLQ